MLTDEQRERLEDQIRRPGWHAWARDRDGLLVKVAPEPLDRGKAVLWVGFRHDEGLDAWAMERDDTGYPVETVERIAPR